MVAAALDSISGDPTFTYTKPGGTGLFADEHTVTISDHDIEPIDVISVDIDGDGDLESFAVAEWFGSTD